MKYEEQAYNRLRKNELRYERKILKDLSNALKIISGEMSAIYDKYAIDGKLTNAEMTRYNRYASMEKNILAVMNETTRTNMKDLNRLLPEQYEESFFNYAWAMDNANGIRINYGVVNPDVLKEITENPWLVSAEERYRLAGKTQLRNALNDGLMIGKSYTKMYKDLKTAVDRLKYEIVRMLRTEGQSVIIAGQDELYERALKKGIRGKIVWVSAKDKRVRYTHQLMDGVAKSEDGWFYGAIGKAPYPLWEGLPAAERINCRCEERFEVEGYSPPIMRTRELGVIPYMLYEQYRKTYFTKAGKLKENYADIVRKEYEKLKRE